MAKKIKIVELDIDVNALLSKATQTKNEIYDLKKAVKSVKDEQKQAEKTIAKYTIELNKLESQGKGNSDAAKEFKSKINELENSIKSGNQSLVQHEAQLKTNQQTYRTQTKMIQAYSEKTLSSLDVVRETNGSINQLGAALKQNKEIYKNLSTEQLNNAEIGGMLNQLISQQDEEYKKLQASIGTTQVYVGDYKNAVKEAASELGLFDQVSAKARANFAPFAPLFNKIKQEAKDTVGTFRNVASGTKSMSTAQKVAAVSSNLFSGSLKVLKIALISTGIGAIVVLLGSLVAWFSKSQKGADKLAQIMAQVGAVIDVLIDRFTKVGGILFDVITGQKSLSQAWDEGKESLSGINDEMEREMKLASKLTKKLQELEKAQILLDIERAGSKRVLKELNSIAEDTSKSYEERLEALNRSAAIESRLLKRSIQLGEERLANQLGEIELTEQGAKTLERFRTGAISADEALSSLGISESTVEDLEKFRDVFVEIENSQAELIEIQTTRNNKNNALIKEQQEKEKAAHQERLKRVENTKQKRIDAINKVLKAQERLIEASKSELEIYYQTNVGIADSLEERLEIERKAKDERLKILDDETAIKIKQAKKDKNLIKQIESEANAERLSINQDFLQAQADLTTEHAEKELSLWIAQNKSKVENTNRLNDELVNAEQIRLNTIYNKKLENLEKEKQLLEKAGQFDYAKKLEYDQAKLQAEDEYQIAKREVEITFDKQKAEDDKLNRALEFEQRLTDLEEQNATEFEMKQELAWQNYENESEALEEQRMQNLISKENFEKQKALIEQQYANVRKEINEAVEQSKIEGYKSVLGQMKDVLGEQTQVGKAAAIAETTINTYQSATKAYQALAGIPIVGPALGATAAALAVAAGLKNVQKIASTNPRKAAKGITLSGPSHASGGIDLYDAHGNHVVEAEGDENVYVLNKRASKEIAALSGINQAFGGIPLTRTVNHAASGGMVSYNMARQGTTNTSLDAAAVAQQMAPLISEAVANGARQGTEIGSKIGTQYGAMAGIQEKRINEQIARSASH